MSPVLTVVPPIETVTDNSSPHQLITEPLTTHSRICINLLTKVLLEVVTTPMNWSVFQRPKKSS